MCELDRLYKTKYHCGNRVTAVLFLFTFGLQLFCVDENGLLDNYDRIFSQSN